MPSVKEMFTAGVRDAVAKVSDPHVHKQNVINLIEALRKAMVDTYKRGHMAASNASSAAHEAADMNATAAREESRPPNLPTPVENPRVPSPKAR